MAKVLIKIGREEKGPVARSFVWISDRLLDFQNDDEVNVFIRSGTEYGIAAYCHGDSGAKLTVSVTKAAGNVIEPLVVELDDEDDVDHASDRFTVQ